MSGTHGLSEIILPLIVSKIPVEGATCSYIMHDVKSVLRGPYLTIVAYIWLIAAAAADIIIAASLAYSLVRMHLNI